MPVPDKKRFAHFVTTHFAENRIVLPMQWQDLGPQFHGAFLPRERKVVPNPLGTLFKEASLNHYHVMAARVMGELFNTYLTGVVHAICDALKDFMKKVSITKGTINGASGTVPPGSVMGPSLYTVIMASAPKKTPQELKYSAAIAKALSLCWKRWHSGLSGTLAYPLFASFPGPTAPPTPNTPVPLSSLTSLGEHALSISSLKYEMSICLNDPEANHAPAIFDSLSHGFFNAFQRFKSETQIQNVKGTGPVHSFAPPLVPAGPVVGGMMLPDAGIWV